MTTGRERGLELKVIYYPFVCPVQNILSDGGPVTVALLWLWEIRLIRLTMTGWPGRSPVVQELDQLGRISISTTLVVETAAYGRKQPMELYNTNE